MPQDHLQQVPVDNGDALDNTTSTDSTVIQHSERSQKHTIFQQESLSSSQAPDRQAACTKQKDDACQGKPSYSLSVASLKDNIIEKRTYWAIAFFALAIALYMLPPQTSFGRHGVLDRKSEPRP